MIIIVFSRKSCLNEIMLTNVVEPERPQKTIWRIRVACWISKATRAHTHTENYIIPIAFPRQQWFRERSSVLRYPYIACLVIKNITTQLAYPLLYNYWL